MTIDADIYYGNVDAVVSATKDKCVSPSVVIMGGGYEFQKKE